MKINININNKIPDFILIPVIAVLVLILLVFMLSDTPLRSLYFFFAGPFLSILRFANMLNAAVPLIFGALGIIIAMKAGLLNLGGEGQIYLGAFTTATASLSLSAYGILGGITAALAGMLASGALAAFSGFCKARWKTNELITTFLFSGTVIHIVNYLITGPFWDTGSSLQSTRQIAENLRLPFILRPSNLNAGIFIALGFVFIVHFFLAKTGRGYELRMAGHNEIFARYGGINTKFNTVLAMFLSGSLYGAAGAVLVLGTHHAAIKGFTEGLGWNGLAVALIAGLNPAAVLPSALFFAWINAGSRAAMQNTNLTSEVALIVQAVIFFLSTSLLIKNIFNKGKNQ